MGVLLRLDSFCLYTPELSTFNESFNEIMRHRARHIQSPSYISLDEHWNHSHLIESVSQKTADPHPSSRPSVPPLKGKIFPGCLTPVFK